MEGRFVKRISPIEYPRDAFAPGGIRYTEDAGSTHRPAPREV